MWSFAVHWHIQCASINEFVRELRNYTAIFFTGKTITKTNLYKVDPLKHHCYIVKLGFTGVYTIFLNSVLNIDCGYSLEPPHRGGSNEYPQSMF